MSRRRLSFGGTNNNMGCDSLASWGCLAFAELFAILFALAGISVAGADPVLAGVMVAPAFLLPALGIWLLARWRRESAARALLMGEALAVETQWYETMAAQQQHEVAAARARYKIFEAEQQARIDALKALLQLNADEFASAVALVFEFLGYTDVVIVNSSSGERAIDIMCRDEVGKKTAVRCRQYEPDTRVEFAEVLQFVDAATQGLGVEGLVFVTTSSYTDAAEEVAKKCDVTLMRAADIVASLQHLRAAREE
jgi:Restriction endonuclease